MALQADLYQFEGSHFNMSEKPKKPMSEAQKAQIQRLADARRGTKMKYTVTEKTLEGRRRGGDTRRGKKMPQYTVSEKKLEALSQLHESMRGKKQTEEQKRKSGDAVKKKYDTDPEFRERQRQAAIKTTMDPEVRQKNSEAQKRLWEDPEYRATHPMAILRPEVIEARLERLRGRTLSDEHKKKLAESTSKAQYARWAEIPLEERQRLTLACRKASQLANTSSLEVQIAALLDVLKIEYTQQYQVGLVHVDFYVPSRHLIIEVNGCWWHGCEQCVENTPEAQEKRQQDRRRQYFLRSQGYNLYTIWEHDMQHGDSEGMIGLMSRLTGESVDHPPVTESVDITPILEEEEILSPTQLFLF